MKRRDRVIPHSRRGAPAGRKRRPAVHRRTLTVLASLLVFLPSPGLVRHGAFSVRTGAPVPAMRCKGSTRARVAISWPTAADLEASPRLGLGARVPGKVRRWGFLLVPQARALGLDPYLVAAVVQVESHGDPLAWNLDSDARGLMQVLHASFEPSVNIRLGVSMLSDLQRRFGSQDLVLAAYNAGPGSVQAYGGVPPFTETRDYVVMVDYYRDLYAGLTLSAARQARFKAAEADLKAYYRRICGKPWGHLLQ